MTPFCTQFLEAENAPGLQWRLYFPEMSPYIVLISCSILLLRATGSASGRSKWRVRRWESSQSGDMLLYLPFRAHRRSGSAQLGGQLADRDTTRALPFSPCFLLKSRDRSRFCETFPVRPQGPLTEKPPSLLILTFFLIKMWTGGTAELDSVHGAFGLINMHFI